MNAWNGLDFLIFLILALNTLLGMSRGATREIISVMCLSVALIFTIKFTVPLAAFFNSSPLVNDVVNNRLMQNFMIAINAGPMTSNLLGQLFYCISMLICFVGAFSICEAVLVMTNVTMALSFPYAALDKKLGAVLGFLRGYVISLLLIVILVFHIFANASIGRAGNSFVSGSYFVSIFQGAAAQLDGLITAQQPERYREIYKTTNPYKHAGELIKQLEYNVPEQNPNPTPQPVNPNQPTQQPQSPSSPSYYYP